MRMILLAGAVLALSACGGGSNQTNTAADANASMDTMGLDNGAMLDANMGGANMGTGANRSVNAAADAAALNGATDAKTRKLMEKDLKTHDHDTNLANGI